MGKAKTKKKARQRLHEDRLVIDTLVLDEQGWEVIEEAAAKFGKDPVRMALAALAREVMRTSIKVEHDVVPTLKFVGRIACGAPPFDEEEQKEWEAELAR